MTENVVGFVVATFVSIVFVAAMLFLANALTGDWTLAVLSTVAVVLGFAAVCAVLLRWQRRHPEEAEKFVAEWGRAGAFMSGARQRREGRSRRGD